MTPGPENTASLVWNLDHNTRFVETLFWTGTVKGILDCSTSKWADKGNECAFLLPSYAPGLNVQISELRLLSRDFSAFTKQNLIAWQKPASSTSTHECVAVTLLPRHLISHSESKGIVQASLRLGFKPSITKSCTSVVTDGGISSGRSPACFLQPGALWCQLEKTWLCLPAETIECGICSSILSSCSCANPCAFSLPTLPQALCWETAVDSPLWLS